MPPPAQPTASTDPPPLPHTHVCTYPHPPSHRPHLRPGRRRLLHEQTRVDQPSTRPRRRPMGKVRPSLGNRANELMERSRFWFLTTLLALYTLHQRTIPRLRSSLPAQVSPAANEVVAPGSSSREMGEARWTNRKLLADLAFVCELFHASSEGAILMKSGSVRYIPGGLVQGACSVCGRAVGSVHQVSHFSACAKAKLTRGSSSKIYDQHWRASLGKG